MRNVANYQKKWATKSSLYRGLRGIQANIWSVIYGLEHGVRSQTYKTVKLLYQQVLHIMLARMFFDESSDAKSEAFGLIKFDDVCLVGEYISAAFKSRNIPEVISYLSRASDKLQDMIDNIFPEKKENEDSDIE